MFLLNSTLVALPTLLGRFIFAQLSFPLTNDLYAFCAGFYTLYAVFRLVQAAYTFFSSFALPQIATEIFVYTILGLKCAFVALFLGIVIPLLIGLVLELIFAVPIRVPVDQSPHFFIYQDWGLGLIMMKATYRLIVARADHIRNHGRGQVPEDEPINVVAWKAIFDQIFQDGIRNLNVTRVFISLIFPLLDKILMILCVPYVFAKIVVPLAGGSLILSSIAYRFGHLSFALAWCLFKLQRPLIRSLRSLHNAIRDDKYKVGTRLHNYTTAMS